MSEKSENFTQAQTERLLEHALRQEHISFLTVRDLTLGAICRKKPHLTVLALRGEEHPLAHQIGEHTITLVALAHALLIHADATHAAEVRLGVGRVHLPEEYPPQRVSVS